MAQHFSKDILERLYEKYNRREFAHPDPIEFLYRYDDLSDREIVALIASSLAYGRVLQIIKSVSKVLNRMTDSPSTFLQTTSEEKICERFSDFQHRFTTCSDLGLLLISMKRVIAQYGSLGQSFLSGVKKDDPTILPALTSFVRILNGKDRLKLIPPPDKGSACKRLNLFLRWMVRKDQIDPGGWNHVPASKLIVPLDTHMHRIGLTYGLTKHKQANIRTALEITEAFSHFSPDDPVKYDFTLTRFGIRDDLRKMSLTNAAETGIHGVSREKSPHPPFIKGG